MRLFLLMLSLSLVFVAAAWVLLATGCGRDVAHGQMPAEGEPVGWVTCRASSVRLLAINDEPVADADNGSGAIVHVRDGGFTVALPPGRHALKCHFEQRNPHAGRTGEPDRIIQGQPRWIVLDIEPFKEVFLTPELHRDGSWSLRIERRREHHPKD